jgi:hypothetical protein
MKKSKIKLWMTPVKELNRWKKNQGVFLFTGNVAQLIIIDMNDPIGVMLQRPLRISRENGVITGVFCLNDFFVKKHKKQPLYIVAAYDRAAKTFVHEVKAEYLPLVLDNPDVRYIGGEERETARIRLGLNK